MKKLLLIILLSVVSSTCLPLYAQTLSIGYQDGSVDKPAHGLSMESVSKKYGQPVKQIAAKGNPPIVRWVYEEFTVYFEGNVVIHSVVNKK